MLMERNTNLESSKKLAEEELDRVRVVSLQRSIFLHCMNFPPFITRLCHQTFVLFYNSESDCIAVYTSKLFSMPLKCCTWSTVRRYSEANFSDLLLCPEVKGKLKSAKTLVCSRSQQSGSIVVLLLLYAHRHRSGW
jgi:hypothetical protein